MIIKENPHFTNLKKKLHRNQLKCLDIAIRDILSNNCIGELKCGDLNGIRTYKFKMIREIWLLAYEIRGNDLILLILFGSHENFYDDLKRLLRSSEL